MLNNKRLLWQYRIFLFIALFIISIILNLSIPIKVSTQEGNLPGTIATIPQENTFYVPQEFRGRIVRKVNPISDKKVIALTFDDGPSPNITPQILDILKEHKIKATFFVIGNNLNNFPELGQRLVAEGNAIGNHTWHHWRRLMNEFTATHEIEDTATLIYETTGVRTSLFRPPNGFLYNGLVDYAQKRKDAVILWSVDSNDWRGQKVSVEHIVEKVLEKVQPGAIILMHDGGGDRSHTVQALPKIIDEITQRGYEFVTVPELLQMGSRE
jgi:peptidoglycan-N-acetylglucosamine deacetylase